MNTVEMYTTPSCHFCHLAKDFFIEHNVSFVEYDVAADAEKRTEMMTKSGQLGVPVIVVGGIHTIVGFNEPKLRELLGIDDAGARIIPMGQRPDTDQQKIAA